MAISAKDGVEVQMAIGKLKIVSKSCLKSCVIALGRANSVPPKARVGAQYITDKSNEYGGCANICGCAGVANSLSVIIQLVKLSKLSWEI